MPLSPVQREVLRALVDTAVPALEVDDDPHGLWATPGTAVGADGWLELFLDGMPPADLAGICQLLDGMATIGFQHQDRAVREVILHSAAALAPEAVIAVQTLRGAACNLAHAITDEQGRNPFWAGYAYPGPVRPVPSGGPSITPYAPSDGEVLRADVVVVGSGAGGGTIAGVLAAAGRSGVVLEMGGITGPADATQLELASALTTMYRQGLSFTADSNVALLAGSTLGGGTTINWQNWVLPSDKVRKEWADAGLDGLDGPEFDKHLAAVTERVGATDACSDLNGPHQRMTEGAKALGWSVHTATRNVDPATYDPETAGFTQFGEPSGSKRSTLTTYLQDAYDAGARLVVHAKAEQVCTTDGRACGVAAVWTDPVTQETRRFTVDAQQVVVACGALETPALLLRSGIGGPAVGKHLRLHPAAGCFGVYEEDQRAWWGPPQAAVMDELRELDETGHGLLVEGSHYYPGVFAFQLSRQDGREHKEAMSKLHRMSHLLFILREFGGGTVTVDDAGEAVFHYALDDERDQAMYRRGVRALAELHLAAGAQELWLGAPAAPVFHRGDDLEAWLARLDQIPIAAGGLTMGSAHQMGSARMGSDPETSVADGRGELHTTPGVWIGDTSAFPTPSGANPMLTCQALAHRTAEFLLQRIEQAEAEAAAA